MAMNACVSGGGGAGLGEVSEPVEAVIERAARRGARLKDASCPSIHAGPGRLVSGAAPRARAGMWRGSAGGRASGPAGPLGAVVCILDGKGRRDGK